MRKLKPKTAWLVFCPAIDYEDSIDPYCICATKSGAEKIKNKIIKWYGNIVNQLSEEPDPDSKEWDEMYDSNLNLVRKYCENKPFNNIMTHKIPTFKNDFTYYEGWVGIVELEFFN